MDNIIKNNILIGNIKKLKSNSNVRNGFLFTFFAFLNNGINFLLLFILARYLLPEGYGKLNLFTTLITVLAILLSLGTNGYIGNSYFRKSETDFKKVINTVFSIASVVLILIIIILLIVKNELQEILGFSIGYQIIAALICFFQLFTTVNLEIWRLKEQPIRYGLDSLGTVFLNFILTLIFIISFHMDWEGRIYAQFIVAGIFFFISLYFLIYRKLLVFQRINIRILKESLSYGAPLIPHLTAGWLRQGMDRYIMNFFCGSTSVGLFSFALNFGNIINIIGVSFNASNSIFLYKNLSNQNSKTKGQLLKQTCLMSSFFFILTTVIFIGSYILIPYFFPKYVDTLPLLFPLCYASFFQCIYYLFVNYLFYYKKTKKLMFITTLVSIGHFILSFAFTRYSNIYTADINLFSNFCICMLVLIYSQRIYPLIKKD